MSDGFNPYQPQATQQGDTLLPGQRPVVATVFGILNLVFGILGVCGNIMGLGMFAFISSDFFDAKMKAELNLKQFDDPVYMGLLTVQMIMTGILSIIIIVSGVSLLKFKPLGRKLANFYAVATIILLITGTVTNVVFTVIPAINEANMPGATPDKIGGAIGGTIGGVFGTCFGMIYPICILYFLNRRKFIDQIEGR